MKVEHNISRLKYLLKLFRLSEAELLGRISIGLKKPITIEDIFSPEIKLNYLKRIDKVFNKGIQYYLDPKHLIENKEASIFFRKQKFNSNLNFGATKIVNQFEELKISLSTISTLSDMKLKRKVPYFSIKDNPRTVATEIREKLYPKQFTNNLRDFLKSLIVSLAENNIYVFEFIETWNKKEKANIDGFFLSPDFIVLKRQQKSFRREIFTLVHELGHYLINVEEVEEVDYKIISKKNISNVERWCNDFSYYFLIGKYANILNKIETANSNNDYHFDLIERISKETNLSVLALFTRLLFTNKISQYNYNQIKQDLNEQYRLKIEEENKRKEFEKEQGIKRGGAVPKPINSPLFVNTLQSAFYEGVINEYEFCKKLNIKPDKLNRYI